METSRCIIKSSVIIEGTHGVLLVKPFIDGAERKPDVPVGTCQAEENPFKAAERIAKYWMNLDIELTGLLSVHTIGETVCFNFIAKPKSEDEPSATETGKPFWVSLDQLKQMLGEDNEQHRSFGGPGSKVRAQEYVQGRRFPLTVVESF